MAEKSSKTKVISRTLRNAERSATAAAPESEPTPAVDDDLYAVAMLKVAMELKRGQASGFDDIFETTLKAMDIDRDAFKRYLSRHMSQLMKTAKRQGY